MKLGIYGGTFNPPHLGHYQAANAAIEALQLDQLLLIPTHQPPHKDAPGEDMTQHRYAMTELFADALCSREEPQRARVSDIELRRAGASYTCDTVLQLREAYPQAQLYLIMGSDMFLTLESWRNPELFLPHVKVVTFARTQSDTYEMLQMQQTHLERTYGLESMILPLPDLIDISSSELRAELHTQYLLPQVYGYIVEHGLYGAQFDKKHLPLEQLRAVSYAWMRNRRIAHVRGVEETAAQLARHYGADEMQARRAGTLHDITKYKSRDEQLKFVEKYGIMLDEFTKETEKLHHAKTGAAIAAAEYGEDEAVVSAIAWHTTGHANMTLLEKIIYMADYIEPNRDFDGVEAVRALAFEDLDAAMRLALMQTVAEKQQEGARLHPDTLAALETMKEGFP